MTGNARFHDWVDVALDPLGAFAAITALRAELDRAEARVAKLEAALRPFVEYVHDDYRKGNQAFVFTPAYSPGGGWIGAEDLRRARAALADKGGE